METRLLDKYLIYSSHQYLFMKGVVLYLDEEGLVMKKKSREEMKKKKILTVFSVVGNEL